MLYRALIGKSKEEENLKFYQIIKGQNTIEL
jgi:hypothetical protein